MKHIIAVINEWYGDPLQCGYSIAALSITVES